MTTANGRGFLQLVYPITMRKEQNEEISKNPGPQLPCQSSLERAFLSSFQGIAKIS